MAKSNKYRVAFTLAIIVALLATMTMFISVTSSASGIVAEADTIAPDGWENWGKWDVDKVEITDLAGSGTSSKPYEISTPQDLAFLSQYVKNGGETKNVTFKLTCNLDMDGCLFVPIGTSSNPFNGSFQGNKCVIKNLYVYQKGSAYAYAGLFGSLGPDAKISRLGINGGIIKNATLSAMACTGGLAGYSEATISESYSTADVIATDTNNVGGLVGYSVGYSVSDVYTNSAVSGVECVGGIFGTAGFAVTTSNITYVSNLQNCFALGSVTGTANVGGICGNVLKTANNVPKFAYAYYNSDKNASVAYAIGSINGVACDENDNYDAIGSTTNSTYGTNKVTALTEANFNSYSVSAYGEGFYKTGRWVKRFESTDGSSRYALGLNVLTPTETTSENYELSKSSVALRIYGYGGGEGEWGKSEDNPYIITTAAQLEHISELVNQGTSYAGTYFRMDSDVDFTDEEFAPIGVYGQAVNRPFKGTFDGNNHTIDNIVVDRTSEEDGKENYVGIFGYIDSYGTVKNLIIGEGCSLRGAKYVGSLAGRCDGTVTQIITKANVVGGSDSGGLVGYTANGSYTHILSQASLAQTAGATGAIYGIIGTASGLKALTNCWYLVDYSATFKTTNSWGSVMVVDRNGQVNCTKADDGTITFEGAGDVGWTPEFRNSSELDISTATNIYTASKTNNQSLLVYARFVKTVTCTPAANAVLSLGSTGRYYQGQTIAITANVSNGYYLNDILVTDNTGTKAATVAYSYSDATGLKATLAMGGTYTAVTADIKAINAPSISARDYDGEATSYSMSITGYDLTYTYSVGYAPKNAGNYILTIIVRKDTIQRGKDYVGFVINPKRLSVLTSDVLLEKEFDASDDWTDTTVSQANVDKVAGDDVVVNAKIRFDNYEAPTAEGIGASETGSVAFTLSGAAKDNYLAPESFNFNTGIITKRTVYVEIEDKYLTYTYDGNASAIQHFGVINQLETIPADIKLNFYLASDTNKTTCDATNAGTYGIKVSSGSANANDVYKFALKEDYSYVINPLAVAVNITGLEDLVYTSNVISASCNFVNEFDLMTYLTSSQTIFTYYRMNDSEEYVEDANHTNAGSYKVVAVLDGNYTVDTTKTNSDQQINEAYFVVSKADSPTITLNVSAGPYSYGGGDVTLSYTGGSPEESTITYTVTSGCGTIADSTLTFTGGGEVKLTVTKAASENYFEGVSEEVVLTVSKRNMTITLNDFSIVYHKDIEFPFEFDGFIQSDLDAGLTTPTGFVLPTIYINGNKWTSGTYFDASDIPYNVTIEKDASCDGYELTYVNLEKTSPKRMTVTPRTITVKADPITVAYGKAEELLTYKVYDGEELLSLTLNGKLTRETGTNAGTYAILAGTITGENNANFGITYESASYTITPITLEITMKESSKKYGEPDPEPQMTVSGYAYGEKWADAVVSGSITRRTGENAYSNTTDYGYYAYSGGSLVMSQNYTLLFHTANLLIYPLDPEFNEDDVTYLLPYGDALKDLTPEITLVDGAKGYFTWVNGNIIPDFSSQEVLSFAAVFHPETRNYKSVQRDIYVKVIPRELELEFTGETTLTYNGKVQKSMTYTLSNGMNGDKLLDTITYSGDMKNIGKYTATVEVGNKSYVLTGSNEITITIKPATLVIYMQDISIAEGETPEVKIIYEGFVGGEDESVLEALPTVDLGDNTSAGYYKITPSGAKAANYDIVYKEASYSICRAGISSDVQNLRIEGEFDYRTELKVEEIKKSESPSEFGVYEDLYNEYKLANGIEDNTEISRVFAIDVLLEGEDVSIEGKRVTMEVPARLRESKNLMIVFIDEDGTLQFADDVSVSGKTITFTAKDSDYIAIVCPPDYTWIILVAVVVILVAAAFAIDAITEKLGVGRHSATAKAKRAARRM